MAAALLLLEELGMGGSQCKSVRIANALRNGGHDIHLAYLNAPHTLRGSLDPALPVVHLDRSGKFSLSALRRLKHYLVEQRISRVACMNLYPLLYAHAAAWQLGKRAPVVSALINITDYPTWFAERYMIVYAPLLRRTKHLVFGCRLQQDKWVDRYRLPAANSRVIYNGVDQAYFNSAAIAESRDQLRLRYGLPLDAFVAISVALLRPEKQQVHLVQAIAALAARGLPIHALLVGEGVQRASIEHCIADLGMRERVRLLGAVDDVRPLLMLADAFVLTSTAGETFSNAALEAMAMGLPVILSRIAGAAEMVEVGRNGFLYPPGDVTELAGYIAALAGDDGLTRKMGRAAMTRVQARFDFRRMVDEYRTLLFPLESNPMPGVELERGSSAPRSAT
jgi:glycosyltransferase involved in cell wall biosynthesis